MSYAQIAVYMTDLIYFIITNVFFITMKRYNEMKRKLKSKYWKYFFRILMDVPNVPIKHVPCTWLTCEIAELMGLCTAGTQKVEVLWQVKSSLSLELKRISLSLSLS